MARVSTLLALATVLLFGGCGSEGGDASPDEPDPRDQRAHGERVDTSVFEAGGSVNAVLLDNPVDLAKASSVVALGEISGVEDGYELLQREADAEGYDIREYTVIIHVKVTHLYKGPTGVLDSSDTIYVRLSRGAEQEGLEDDGGPSTITPVAAFAAAIPAGSKVIVMADPVIPPASETITVIHPDRGAPIGVLVLSGTHPQALTFPARTGGTNSWTGKSFEEIVSDLTKAFAD